MNTTELAMIVAKLSKKNIEYEEEISFYKDKVKNVDYIKQTFIDQKMKVNTLFAAIKHGDGKHMDWLKNAIDAHFKGIKIPKES